MRELVALFFLIALVSFGWRQAYRDHLASFFPQLNIAPSRVAQLAAKGSQVRRAEAQSASLQSQAQPQQAGQPVERDNSWMWRRSILDAPVKGGSRGR
jgi:hypothetical protein